MGGVANLKEFWNSCTRCEIGRWAHKHVYGEGAIPAPFLFVGEAPGVSEDALGTPFIGRSGKLLREAMAEAGFVNGDCFITNLVACRPCDEPEGPNRAPTRVEVSNCSTRLHEVVISVRPSVIVAVGQIAMHEMSGEFSNYRIRSIKHPAFILRNGGKSGPEYDAWLQSVKDLRVLVK